MKEFKGHLSLPMEWDKKLMEIELGSVNLKIEGHRVDDSESLYSIGISIFSKRYAKFLEALIEVRDELKNCPRIRAKKISGEMLMGRVEHTVLRNLESFESYEDVDPKIYRLGDNLLGLGYCHILESSLNNFLILLSESLILSSDSKFNLLEQGILFKNLPSFDAFYAFVFMFFSVGYQDVRFLDIVDSSGVRNNYPKKLFSPEEITSEELTLLRRIFDNLQ